MSGKVFLDTNVLLYAFSLDDDEKHGVGLQLLQTRECFTCVQALNEFCNVCLKKLKLNREMILRSIRTILTVCEVYSVSAATLQLALLLHERYGYAYYDCVMLASALENDCTKIYTEDMSSGQMIENRLLIINPFEMAGESA